jgi:queuosine precursor transporter
MADRAPLPSEQHRYPELPELDAVELHGRRERLFLLFAGIFLGSLTMLNIIGVTRFIDLSFTIPLFDLRVPMPVAVGVLPYPITFLCTDFISELYGRRRANEVVLVGLLLNLWVVFILFVGGVLPGTEGEGELFSGIRTAAFGAVTASMIAYLAAQLVDVQLFHFWKRLTRGRHLWLRNNGSTLVSQLVDTTAVILITHYYAGLLPIDAGRALAPQLATYIAAGYTFKVAVAAADTVPFYLGAHYLSRYLRLPPPGEPPRPLATAAVEAGVG